MDADDLALTDRAPRVPGSPWLEPWLAWLDAALHLEILRVRARYELSMDELRGLYVSDAQVDRLVRREHPDPAERARLCQVEEHREALQDAAYAVASPLRVVAEEFSLDRATLPAVVACLAPETDLAYQTLYAYLNDDVTRRLPTVDLCARLAGAPLEPTDTVVSAGLLQVHRVEAAPLWRSAGLSLAEPLRRFLLGDAGAPAPPREPLDRTRVVLLEARNEEAAAAVAAAVAAEAGGRLVRVAEFPSEPGVALPAAVLTARLHRATLFLVAGDLTPPGAPEPAAERCRLIADARVHCVVAVQPGQAVRLQFEGAEVERLVLDRPCPTTRPLTALDGIAERVPGLLGWDDLVLPAGTLQRVVQLADAAKHRHRVFGTWSFGRHHGGHASVRALFSGPSGTGKTMSASVLAGVLDLPLYRVDLAAVVSKYVGETEKNLDRVLTAAEQSNAVLLFDEADALFGKRTEVKDAHDRYANIETAFLLQRIESYDGIVILATNLPGNLDDAFSRRIHFHVEFPMPDETLRAELWRKALPRSAPVAPDVDPAFLAGMYPMSGGDIRSAALVAAFLAAGASQPIGMTHLVKALARLRRQQGKVPSVSEFGDYLHLARAED